MIEHLLEVLDLPAGFHLLHVAHNRLYAWCTVALGDEVRVFEYTLP